MLPIYTPTNARMRHLSCLKSISPALVHMEFAMCEALSREAFSRDCGIKPQALPQELADQEPGTIVPFRSKPLITP